jgi:predicted alpha/beta-fold hydrolase
MTEWLLQHYGHLAEQDFRTADEYFGAYAVPHHGLSDLRVRTTIITAMDDPVIPVVDFYALTPHPLLDVQIHETGGHMAFMNALPLRHRLPDLVMAELRRA